METSTTTGPADRRRPRRTTDHVLRRLIATALFALAAADSTVETAEEPGALQHDVGSWSTDANAAP